jgi:hypothetical protein
MLIALVEGAEILGLPVKDINAAKEYLDHHEFGLCFDTIVTQTDEYGIKISKEFYQLIAKAGNKMDLSEDNYSFMKELIRANDQFSKSVNERLAEILNQQ